MMRILSFILALMMLVPCCAGAAGYSKDPDAINDSAKSVLLLAVYDISNRLIATGSGFVAFSEEYVVTNCHVIEGADVIVAYTDWGETLWINRVLCADSGRDIAILVFDEPSGLEPLAVSESSDFTRGAPAVAIGNPLGFRNSVSIGTISAADEEEYTGYINFTAPISSGSSGGALLDDDGKVIGITTSTYGASGDAQNLNFAVSSQYVCGIFKAHKNDTSAALGEWKEIDIKTKVERPKDNGVPETRGFTIKNYAGFSISEVYLYPDGAKTRGKARNTEGWLYKNSQMSFTVTDEEVKRDTLWTLKFCFLYNKRNYYVDYTGVDLRNILGRTLVITMDKGNTIILDIE